MCGADSFPPSLGFDLKHLILQQLVFATASEVEYPKLLWNRMAEKMVRAEAGQSVASRNS